MYSSISRRTRVKGGGGARGNVRTGLAAALGLDDPAAAEQIFLGGRASFFRQQMLYAAEAAGRSPGAIDFDPDDVDRLRAALARGRGAIVWVDETCAGPIIAKRALAAAGFAPRHVSAHLHGVSFTGFGLAMLNPRHLRAENRYLAERLVFGADETADVLRRVLRALKAGGVVTMTNGVFSGSGFVELPFGPRGRFSLSTTALGLSIRHGAPLFTLAAVELEPFARYRIELGPEIVPAPGQTDGGHGAVVAGACAARDQILARLRRWPEQYPALPGGRFETTRFPELRPAAH